MRISVLLAVASLLVLAGCSARHIPLSDPDSLQSANATLSGAEVEMRLSDGRTSVVTDVQFGEDEVSWTNLWSGERVSVPPDDVIDVRLKRPGRGFFKLVLYGSATVPIFRAALPVAHAAVLLGIPIWILVGPPTFIGDADVFEVEYSSSDPPDDEPGGASRED